ncbi:HD domain-containing phosphohydrolase [Iodidimonas sp. SYSU 1G8]|uniref:HD domain-containing phosphohydrolase n=1 Tax=Iodidimonas sp. SYSU 1G8 TaxID=3133967 RepID=UPI0031FEFFD7
MIRRSTPTRFADGMELLGAVWDHVGEALLLTDAETGIIVDANRKAEDMTGIDLHQLIGMPQADLHPLTQREAAAAVFAAADENAGFAFRRHIARADGVLLPVDVTSSEVLHLGRGPTVVTSLHHTLKRLSEDDEADRLNLALTAVYEATKERARADTLEDLDRVTCEGVVSAGGYALCWIGWADQEDMSVRVAAAAGASRAYVEGLELSWADVPMGRGPAGTAIRRGRFQITNDVLADTGYGPWRDHALQHGIRSLLSMPLMEDGRAIGAFTVGSKHPNAFTSGEIDLFQQFAAAHMTALGGLKAKRAYADQVAKNEAAAERIERALEQAVETLSEALSGRDPYTADHQRRVADMADRIAVRMDLAPQRRRVLRLAAMVHDIGKIQVPVELLTRPGRLKPVELQIIRRHAKATLDILGKIDWPWPLAEIASQHHERMDGSGYPLGLKGDQLLLEGKILAVADIVESMSTDRPYRQALGMEAALAEIRRQAGAKLDPDVVAAAIDVFGDTSAAPLAAGATDVETRSYPA